MSTDKGTGPNPATPSGIGVGNGGPDQRTLDLLEYQNQKYGIDSSNPLESLMKKTGRKVREIDPNGTK